MFGMVWYGVIENLFKSQYHPAIMLRKMFSFFFHYFRMLISILKKRFLVLCPSKAMDFEHKIGKKKKNSMNSVKWLIIAFESTLQFINEISDEMLFFLFNLYAIYTYICYVSK